MSIFVGLLYQHHHILCKYFFSSSLHVSQCGTLKILLNAIATARTHKHTLLLCNYLPYLNLQFALNISVSPAPHGKENIPNICFVFWFIPFNDGVRVLLRNLTFLFILPTFAL